MFELVAHCTYQSLLIWDSAMSSHCENSKQELGCKPEKLLVSPVTLAYAMEMPYPP
jgi:hypothetical protein